MSGVSSISCNGGAPTFLSGVVGGRRQSYILRNLPEKSSRRSATPPFFAEVIIWQDRPTLGNPGSASQGGKKGCPRDLSPEIATFAKSHSWHERVNGLHLSRSTPSSHVKNDLILQ